MGTKFESFADRESDNRFISAWIAHFDEIRARVNAAKPSTQGKFAEPVFEFGKSSSV